MATIKFLIKSKNSPSNIYVRYCNGKAVDLTAITGLSINPEFWDSERQQLRNLKEIENRDGFNIKLSELKNFIIKEANRFYEEGDIFDKPALELTVKKHFNRPAQEKRAKNEPHNVYVVDFCNYWLDNKADSWRVKPGKYMSEKAKTHYRGTVNLLSAFQGKDKLKLKTFGLSEIERFAEFLQSKRYSVSTVSKLCDRVRFFLNRAVDAKLSVADDFNGRLFLESEEETDGIYLNEGEIQAIYNYDFSDDELMETVADNMLLQTAFGLRVSDFMFNLDLSKINNGLIKLKTIKTGTWVVIPINPMAKSILDKRHGNLPAKLPENEYNRLIKKVCEKVGIKELVYGKLFNPQTKRKEFGYREKHLYITSHVCRASAATNLAGKVDDNILLSVFGWSSTKMLNHYNRKSKTEYAMQLQKYFENQNN